MGLDQYWFARTPDKPTLEDQYEVAYHRKVPALQAFMEDIWNSQGNSEEFNCEYLLVTTEMLDDLEEACRSKSLQEDASGFFWGSHDDNDYIEIMKSIEVVRQEINEGNQVYYYGSY